MMGIKVIEMIRVIRDFLYVARIIIGFYYLHYQGSLGVSRLVGVIMGFYRAGF
jgi:hypothetical protein